MTESSSFDPFHVKCAPPTVYYIPDFITSDEEEYLMNRVASSPKPKWNVLSNRRLQNWGGIVGKSGLIPDNDLPDWLQLFIGKVFDVGVFPLANRPNHVLINEYLPGQGIMPHVDGPVFLPIITTINLGSHTLLDFYRCLKTGEKAGDSSADLDSRYVGSLLLQPRSLVILRDDMYSAYMHGIKMTACDSISAENADRIFNLHNLTPKLNFSQTGGDAASTSLELQRDRRVSVTIRNVPNVSKLCVSSLIFRQP